MEALRATQLAVLGLLWLAAVCGAIANTAARKSVKEQQTSQTEPKEEDKKDRAALFINPRIFPFLEGFFPPHFPGPVSFAPSGEVPPPLPAPPEQNFLFPAVHPSKPDCPGELTFCVYDRTYPEDKVNAIIDRYYNDVRALYLSLNPVPPSDLILYDNRTHHYRNGGHFICESSVSYIRPGWAQNIKGEWVAVLNTELFPQTVRVEICKYREKRCEYLPPCYKSRCVQRYSIVKLLCADPHRPTSRPVIDIFEMPSACSCFVDNFTYY